MSSQRGSGELEISRVLSAWLITKTITSPIVTPILNLAHFGVTEYFIKISRIRSPLLKAKLVKTSSSALKSLIDEKKWLASCSTVVRVLDQELLQHNIKGGLSIEIEHKERLVNGMQRVMDSCCK